MRSRGLLSRFLALDLLALVAAGLLLTADQSLGQSRSPSALDPGGRLDVLQFRSVCEQQKPQRGSPSAYCRCAATVYERIVRQELARFDERIKHYEDKMRSEAEKITTYARAADRERDRRKEYVLDSLRSETAVFKDIMMYAVRECTPR